MPEVDVLTEDEEADLRSKMRKGALAWAHGALFASLDASRAQEKRLREALEKMESSMRTYFTYHGADHEDPECPEDDTCRCPMVRAVNAAFEAAGKALKGQ